MYEDILNAGLTLKCISMETCEERHRQALSMKSKLEILRNQVYTAGFRGSFGSCEPERSNGDVLIFHPANHASF